MYERLSARIDWFEDVVGTLQPILHDVGRAIGKLAMMARAEREATFGDEISAIESRVRTQDHAAIDLDQLVDESIHASGGLESPVTLTEIERLFLNSESTRHRFLPHGIIEGAYRFNSENDMREVTFRPPVFDRHPYSVELLTYGNPTFDTLLNEVGGDPVDASSAIYGPEAGSAMVLRDSGSPPVAVCVVREDGGVFEVGTFAKYEEVAGQQAAPLSDSDRKRAAAVLREARARVEEKDAAAAREVDNAKRRGLREEARRILIESAHIVEARDGLFAGNGFDRLLERGVPYPGLITVAGGSMPPMSLSDPYRLSLEGKADGVLTRNLSSLKEQGMEVLRRYRAVSGK